MELSTLTWNQYRLIIRYPEGYEQQKEYPVMFLLDGTELELLHLKGLNTYQFLVIGIVPNDRLNEYTPWFAPALRENTHDFLGQADQFLKELEVGLIPYIRQLFSMKEIGMIGYSLGGLFATYSLFQTNLFDFVISLCGSFWYPNFADYVNKTPIKTQHTNIFLLNSLEEGIKHENILKKAVERAQAVHQAIGSKTERVSSVWVPGGHHERKVQKYQTSFDWLVKVYSK